MFRMLAKDVLSLGKRQCPALYLDDDPGRMIAQGKRLSGAETEHLVDLAADETAVAIPTETVLRAVARYAKEQGADELSDQIEGFLVDRGM
jgi:hypothetical protein